jgi:hypothetical protein
MRWALPFILFSLGASLSAQEKIVSGSATVELLPGWSIERAQRQAYQLAILNALQTNFPSHIAQASKYILQNRTTGSTASTQTYFYLTSDQYIGAEWLQTTSIRYETSHEKGTWYITCKVKGRARPRTEPPLPLDIRPLRCQDTACFTLDFKDGDPLYLYFRTPVAGYLQIFWEDSGYVYRLLPYQNSRLQAFSVRPDTTYLFFAPATQNRTEAFWTDELLLTAEAPEVLHRLYVLLSPYPLAAPPEKYDAARGFHIATLDAFHDWLLSERLRNDKLTIRILDLSVRK